MWPAYVDGRKPENISFCINALLLHSHVDVWLFCNLSLDGKLCVRDDKIMHLYKQTIFCGINITRHGLCDAILRISSNFFYNSCFNIASCVHLKENWISHRTVPPVFQWNAKKFCLHVIDTKKLKQINKGKFHSAGKQILGGWNT